MEAGDDNKTLDLNLDSQIELNWKEGVKSLVQTTENVEQAWPAREEVTIFPTVDWSGQYDWPLECGRSSLVEGQ